ncbi:YybH family protein [Streptomyces tritici]|uniref:YybH family protein n=1 Tax=Streptomyces tritici TaxID=2054410 RepID=UPI003AEF85AA
MTNHETEIRAFLADRAIAQQTKDLDKLMSFYAPDAVYYDAVAPLRFTGEEEIRRNFQRWFDGYEGDITLETHDLTLAVGGDTAFAYMLHRDSGKRKGDFQGAVWVRETTCLQRSEGAWAITHEHVSIPIDPATFMVWLPQEKDQPAA